MDGRRLNRRERRALAHEDRVVVVTCDGPPIAWEGSAAEYVDRMAAQQRLAPRAPDDPPEEWDDEYFATLRELAMDGYVVLYKTPDALVQGIEIHTAPVGRLPIRGHTSRPQAGLSKAGVVRRDFDVAEKSVA